MSIIEGAVQRGAGVERGPGATFYADATNGSDSNDGKSWTSAKLTIAAALALMGEGDTLFLSGKFKEQVTLSNLLGGISFIGAAARLPAHADAPWASGASWLPPDSPTAATALLTLRSQGVTVENILFDAPADAAAIKLSRNALSGNDEYDASHFHAKNCRFTSGQSGIENDGGCGFCIIEDCRFYDLTNGIKCLGTAVAVPLRWIIRNNTFQKNTNHLISSFNDSEIKGNSFTQATVYINTAYNAGQGSYNVVFLNALGGTYTNEGGYTCGANEEWGGNFNSITGGVTAADPAPA